MKKIILSLATVAMVLGAAMGVIAADVPTVKVPYDQKGNQAVHPFLYGAKYKRVTTTNEILVTSGTAVLLGVVASSAALSDFAVFRDTNATNGSGDIVLGKYYLFLSSNVATGNYLPYPIEFAKGITVDAGSLATDSEFTVLYRNTR